MMNFFLFLIWAGGALGNPDKEIGFSDSDARHIKVELPTARGLLKIECRK